MLKEKPQTPQKVADNLNISVDKAKKLLESFIKEKRAFKKKEHIRYDGGITLEVYYLNIENKNPNNRTGKTPTTHMPTLRSKTKPKK